MIYTITLNPAIDYVVKMDSFEQGGINRSEYDYKEAGGKGINVSRVLHQFGQSSTALGFVGGFTGKFITDSLTELKIPYDFVQLQQDTRINIKIKTETDETEVNGLSPAIGEAEYQALLAKLKQLKEGDIVVLAGSLPHSLSKTVYRQMVSLLNEQGAIAVLDTSGTPLKEAIQASPVFIKPNHHELADLFDEEVRDDYDIVQLAKRLHQDYGINHVLVSMAKAGAIYVGDSGVFKLLAPKGKAVHSVGAGDSAVAGFICKWYETTDARKAAAYAIAAGSATAFSKTLCTKAETDVLLQQVEVIDLSRR
ncbi:1-phosphofructokinase [Gracilibacillus caseinilyticus]|uniref:Tagatose-6-phosphate kinase n=1 Tax=Gracilibacillus caseinilyticus TaxID=2932256 RepID=A0ABY4F0B1_9BACI|nr:1-phosphofructokinase [Gracilibacillus caseinilyticus]UOQ49948.1 1-phosphofructokinase [Gracilibacillus caseinilyticus]